MRISEVHTAADNPAAALEYLEQAKARLNALGGSPEARADLSLRIADCLRRRGDMQAALSETLFGLDELGETGSPVLRGKLLARQAAVQLGLGDYPNALAAGREAYELLRQSAEHAEIGFLELTLGNILYRQGEIRKSHERFESALFTFRRIDHREGIARALNNLGVVLKNGPRWADGLDLLTRALAVTEEAGNYARVAQHCVNLGIIYTKLCDWELAEQYLTRALTIHKEVGNTRALSMSLIAVGHLHRRRGQRDLAAQHYAEARRICEAHSYGRELALCFEAEGDLLADDKRYPEARLRLAEGLEVARSVAPEGDVVPEILRRLAAVALAQGDAREARQRAAEAARAARRIGDNVETGAAARILGGALAQLNRNQAAARALERSLALISQTPDRLERAYSQAALARHIGRLWTLGETTDRRLRDRAVELMREAWAFLASAELMDPAAEMLVDFAGLRFSLGQLDEALRDIARAHALAQRQGRQDLLRRLDIMRGRLEEQSAQEALLISPEVNVIEEWSRLFDEGESREACLEAMLAFIARRVESDGGFVAAPSESGPRIEATFGSLSERGKEICDLLQPYLNGNRICLATDLTHDPRFAKHAGGALAGVRSFAALTLALPEGRGMLYLDRRGESSQPYGMGDFRLLSVVSGLLGLGLVQLRRERAIDQERSLRTARTLEGPFSAYITAHAPLVQLFSQLERLGDSTTSVLILGETGTGKGLLAQCIHRASSRAEGPFVSVNCAALPEPLLESELFGHAQGSFTGAHRAKRGLFEVADGGTILLDEISRTSLAVQAKLLQVLDSHEIRPVGSTRAKQVNVRVVCASNADLREAIGSGQFLEDLFYRLNDFTVNLPPLRERPEDLPLLIEHFYDQACREMKRSPRGLARQVRELLLDHQWRGNIRELMQVVRRLVALSEDGEMITTELLPHDFGHELLRQSIACGVYEKRGRGANGRPGTLRDEVARLERRLIAEALEASAWNRSEVARSLRISYPSLLAKIKRFRLRPRA